MTRAGARAAEMARWYGSAALAVLVFTAGPAWLQGTAGGDAVVRIATLPNYRPFTDYAPDAERKSWVRVPPGRTSPVFRGYSWAVVREAFHAMGRTVRLRIVPWARAMRELHDGKVDLLFPTGKKVELRRNLTYSDRPVNSVDFHVYVRKDFSRSWPGLSTLNGLRIAALPRWNFGNRWKRNKKIRKYTVQSIEQGFDLLRRGRIAGFVGYGQVWDRYLGKAARSGRFEKLPRFGGTRQYVTARKSDPRGERLVNLFDRGKARIAENGVLDRIAERW